VLLSRTCLRIVLARKVRPASPQLCLYLVIPRFLRHLGRAFRRIQHFCPLMLQRCSRNRHFLPTELNLSLMPSTSQAVTCARICARGMVYAVTARGAASATATRTAIQHGLVMTVRCGRAPKAQHGMRWLRLQTKRIRLWSVPTLVHATARLANANASLTMKASLVSAHAALMTAAVAASATRKSSSLGRLDARIRHHGMQ
jgi:hypothetical protein